MFSKVFLALIAAETAALNLRRNVSSGPTALSQMQQQLDEEEELKKRCHHNPDYDMKWDGMGLDGNYPQGWVVDIANLVWSTEEKKKSFCVDSCQMDEYSNCTPSREDAQIRLKQNRDAKIREHDPQIRPQEHFIREKDIPHLQRQACLLICAPYTCRPGMIRHQPSGKCLDKLDDSFFSRRVIKPKAKAAVAVADDAAVCAQKLVWRDGKCVCERHYHCPSNQGCNRTGTCIALGSDSEEEGSTVF